MSSVVPLRSSSCQSPDLVLPRPFPSVLTTRAFDHSRRRWFGTCSCQPVPRGPPSSIKQLHTLGPPRPIEPVPRFYGTPCRTNADTHWPAAVKSPHPAASPSSVGSTCWGLPFLPAAPPLAPEATCESASSPSGPPLASAHSPEVCRAVSNRSSPLGPRHTPPDTRLAHARVSPPTPGVPIAPAGTHTSNPGNPHQI